jgi:glutamate formiminotransferase/formiminotetrahydrofolate cyclodeaminase
MERIVECVPNFSEGRDQAVIDRITAAIVQVDGVMLLDVDSGRDTNRTVVTFAGEPEAVLEAAYQAIRCAAELIDMRRHRGAHARMGATDVCPFVPVSGVTMAECVDLARRLGQRVAEELAVPVYLYEEAASAPERRSLAWLRSGEYEGLAEKLQRPDFLPDFGKAEFNPRAGATVIGARRFLIAWNINLNTGSARLAQEIAVRLREKGGRVRNRATGELETVAGLLPAVRAVGWYIDEYGLAQVSVNLLDYQTTPLHRVFEEAEKLAAEYGLRVTGSELVGMVPLAALVDCGRHFLARQGASRAVSETELVRMAVQSLGLGDVARFDPQRKIIEYRLRRPDPLVGLTLARFADELASGSPAPGGGSVAALAGALSASLSAMVGNLTFGRRGHEDVSAHIEILAIRAQELKQSFLEAVDRDTAAFNGVMAAIRLPKKTEAEVAHRRAQVEAANKEAAAVPLAVLERSLEAIELALEMVQNGNPNSLSDAGVACLTAETAGHGAFYNVMINLGQIEDAAFRDSVGAQAAELDARIEALAGKAKITIREALQR